MTDLFSDVAKTIGDTVRDLITTSGVSIGSDFNTGTHKFPGNLSAKYFMNIVFYRYQRQTLNDIGIATPLGSVKLPIPANLMDAQGVNYDTEELSTSLGGASSALMGNDPGGAIKDAAGALAVGGAAGALKGPLGGILGAKYGLTANPFLTVLFKSPQYREYDFAWRLTPRNPAESQTLQAIYASVKYHQAPTRSGNFGGAVLTYPSLVKVSIKAGNESLYPFKYGVIKNSSFNFAPDGAPSFFKNGNPTSVDFRISIQEVEYFLKNDQQRMFSKI